MKPVAAHLRVLATLQVIVCVVAACSPELNWREVHSTQGTLMGLLPCRPSKAERPLSLAGARVDYQLQSCQAGGVTWAFASADVRDPAAVGPALVDLGRSMQANLAAAHAESRRAEVPGMTPHDESARWFFVGRQPDGTAVEAQLIAFSRGTVVYEALALGARLEAGPAETFFGSLRLK